METSLKDDLRKCAAPRFGSGVYAGPTQSSSQVFGRQLGCGDSLEQCGFTRLCTSCDDACPTLVMKAGGAGVMLGPVSSRLKSTDELSQLVDRFGKILQGRR